MLPKTSGRNFFCVLIYGMRSALVLCLLALPLPAQVERIDISAASPMQAVADDPDAVRLTQS